MQKQFLNASMAALRESAKDGANSLNGKNLTQCQNGNFHPLSPKFLGVAGGFIFTAEKRSPDATQNAMVGSSIE